ncbi:MAG: hypothetical protein NC081_04495 [Roseburia sp.]|nr:hypothetical protein [Roseburia sp.]
MPVGLYWAIEYGKVLTAYLLVMYLWPSVVFRGYLKGKGRLFSFLFCTVSQILVVNLIVLGLGLLHLLNAWTVRAVFLGIFLYAIYRMHLIDAETKTNFSRLVTGECGVKLFGLRLFGRLGRWFKRKAVEVWRNTRPRLLEHALLLGVVVYAMIYFTYGAFQDYSYGFGDMYTHHSWIYGLIQGDIFSDGVYPEAMHCFIYMLHTLFGIEVYSIQMFLAGIHIIALIVAMYAFLRELLHGKYTPFLIIIAFLILDLTCINQVFSMSRLQWTLPQEFGLFTQYVCAVYLVKYLKTDTSEHNFKIGKLIKKAAFMEQKYVMEDYLLLFTLALAASLSIHFYTTIMAFFVCASVAIFLLPRIFNKKHFVPLVLAVILGLLIAMVPMCGALLEGKDFQGSIDWALGVISGTDPFADPVPGEADSLPEAVPSQPEDTASLQPQQVQTPEGISSGQPAPERSFTERLSDTAQKIGAALWDMMWDIYYGGYATLYTPERALVILLASGFMAVLWLLYRIGFRFFGRSASRETKGFLDGYISLTLAATLFMFLYGAPTAGLPEVVAGARLCTTIHFLALAAVLAPVDLALCLPEKRGVRLLPELLAVAGCFGVIFGVVISGSYHGYLYYELTRYNAAVRITDSIMDTFPKNSYTIVSPTDELYQVIQRGRHEELYTFVLNAGKEEPYRLPTEHIFIYLEKKPLEYAQSHFFAGPKWLALEKYPAFYSSFVSQCPDITTSEISREQARGNIAYAKLQEVYSNLDNRTVLSSKVYEWCEAFERAYPQEMEVFYEDEDFVCYYIHQNPRNLFDLVIDR